MRQLVDAGAAQSRHDRGLPAGLVAAQVAEVHGRKEWETYFGREALERQLRFCDHFLKGIDNDWSETPRVRYEVRERFYEGQEKAADAWPLPDTRYVPLYLNAVSRTLASAATQPDGSVTYNSTAPNTDGGRAIFVHRFERDTELTGYMKLKLWVSTDAGDDLDLFVGIRKLDRRGRELRFPTSTTSSTAWSRGAGCACRTASSTSSARRRISRGSSTSARSSSSPARSCRSRSRSGRRARCSERARRCSSIVQGGELHLHARRTRCRSSTGASAPAMTRPSTAVGTPFTAGGAYDSHLLVPVIDSPPSS